MPRIHDTLCSSLQLVSDLYEEALDGMGLTPRQLAVLEYVEQNDGCSQTAVVAHVGMDRSTTSDVVNRLCRNGLLIRRRSKADARAYNVRVTDAGRAHLRAAQAAVTTLEDGIPEKVRTSLFEACAQLKQHAPAPVSAAA